jgi:predicted nucleotidyltransferase
MRDEVISRLKQHEPGLKRLRVQHLYLFGSTARGRSPRGFGRGPFFDHPEGALGLFQLMDVKEAAARFLGCKTGIMTRRSLHSLLKQRIEAPALQVF